MSQSGFDFLEKPFKASSEGSQMKSPQQTSRAEKQRLAHSVMGVLQLWSGCSGRIINNGCQGDFFNQY